MEKKSLGRGLEDIADIFISQKKQSISFDDSSMENVSDVVVGYYPGHPLEGSRRRVSSFEEKIRTIKDNSVKLEMNRSNTDRPFEHGFSEKGDDRQTGNIESNLKNNPDVCEIVKHMTSKKEMGFFNTPDVQQNIITSLSQHLRQNYTIKNIELVREEKEVSETGIKSVTQENVLIFIQDK